MVISHSPARRNPTGLSFSKYFSKPFARQIAPLVLAILVLAAIPCNLFADVGVSLYGALTDTSGLPIDGATIVVDPGGIGTQTDWSGSFELRNLSEGLYTLTISRLGYETEVIRSIRIRQGETTRLRLSLAASPLALPEAQVFPPSYADPTLSRSDIILTKHDWENFGAQTLADVLRQTPGVTMLEGGRISRISIRGSPSRAVEIDRDGITLKDISTGETDLTTINLRDLEAIGIETGGSGGKIHLISNDLGTALLKDRPTIRGSVATYSTDGIQSDAAIGANIMNTKFQIAVGGTNDRGKFQYTLDNGSKHQRINNGLKALNGSLRLDRKFGSLDYRGTLSRETANRGAPGLIYDPPTPDAHFTSERLTGQLRARYTTIPFFTEWSGFVQNYYSQYSNPEYQIHPETGIPMRFNPEKTDQDGSRFGTSLMIARRATYIENQFHVKYQEDHFLGRDLQNNRVRIGVGYGSAVRSSTEVSGGIRAKTAWRTIRFSFSPLLSYTLVSDRQGATYNNILPEISTTASRINDWGRTSLSLRWNRSVTVPPFNTLFMTENIYAVGNKDLLPERGESYEATLEFKSNFPSAQATISITPFRRTIDDLIIWKRNAFSKYYPDNVTHCYAKGIEISSALSLLGSAFNASGSYIYNKSTNETPGDVNRGNYTPLNPLHSGSANLSLHKNSLSYSLSGLWVDRRYSTMANFDPISTAGMSLPPYATYDISIGYNPLNIWGKPSIVLGVDNILDSEYRIVERNPMPGRTYYLRISVESK